jgi:hypothetical protein
MENFLIIIFGFTLLLILSLIIAITINMKPFSKLPVIIERRERGPFWIGGCAGTRWGCCEDGVTARLDQEGSNCPAFIGGCKGTRFGCCPDGITAKADETGSNCKPDMGCASTQFGCCSDGLTAKMNKEGTNCPK